MKIIKEAIAGMSETQRRHLVLELLAGQAKEMSPMNFKGFITGAILANLLGGMTDEYFQRFCEVAPCDEPGCNCVKVSQQAADFFKFLRDDFGWDMSRRKSLSQN